MQHVEIFKYNFDESIPQLQIYNVIKSRLLQVSERVSKWEKVIDFAVKSMIIL